MSTKSLESGDSAGLYAASAGGSAMMAFSSAYAQAQAAKAQGRFQSVVADANSKMSLLQSEDALRRGSKAAEDALKAAGKFKGSQRAALAANGIDPNELGTGYQLQEDTAAMGAMEALNIKNNAWRESFGYRVNAASASAQGQFTSMAADNMARNTLITGGLQAANSALSGYANYKYGKKIDNMARYHPELKEG